MPDSYDYTTGTNSENVRLLQALIDDAPEYTEDTNSRNANILKSIINNTEYTDAPQSEIEELLLRLKAKIGGEIEVDELNVTENGVYNAGVNKAYNPVTVELPLSAKTITENGTYNASSDNADGYSSVTVDVEGYQIESIPNTPTAIATITDASALPMPSLKVGIEATQDLHGYDNPWPAGGGKNKVNIADFTVTSQYYGSYVSLKAGTYTVSYDVKNNTTITGTIYFVKESGGNLTVNNISASENDRQSGTFTLESDDRVRFTVSGSASGYNYNISKIQVESGSTATSYTPYENECPISGWDEVNVPRCGKNVWDEEWENGYWSRGIYISASSICCKNKIPVKPNTSYYIKVPSGNYFYYTYYDKGKNYIDLPEYDSQGRLKIYESGTITIPDNVYYITWNIASTYGTTYNNDISINYPSTDTEYHAYNGTTYTTQLKDGQGNPFVCYGGELSNENGVQTLTLTHGYIASYNGETLPSTWISDRDVYAEGTTPTTGAEVVYLLETPLQITQDSITIASHSGINNIWADSGDVIEGSYFKEL